MRGYLLYDFYAVLFEGGIFVDLMFGRWYNKITKILFFHTLSYYDSLRVKRGGKPSGKRKDSTTTVDARRPPPLLAVFPLVLPFSLNLTLSC